MKVVKKPGIFLEIEVRRCENKIGIRQRTYIEKLARKFDASEGRFSTLMKLRLRVVCTWVQNEYPRLRSLIHGLSFAARNTRPNIIFAANYVFKFQAE